jgi:Na+/melibiose symporter-like transporter
MAIMIGLITVLIVPVIVGGRGGDGRAQIAAVGWFIMILIVPAVLLTVTRVPEVPVREDLTAHWRDAVAALLRSRPLRYVLGADLMFGFATGVAGALYLFALEYGLGLSAAQSQIILLVYFVVACLFAPLWPALGRRWEKHKVLACTAIYSLAAPFAYFFVPHGSFYGALAVTAIFAIPYTAARVMLKSMMADVTDDDRLKSGRMQAGIFFSLLLTTEKLGIAIAAISLTILAAIGFQPKTVNDASVLTGLMLLFAAAPAVFHGLAALILWRYPLGRTQQAEMRAAIALRFGA